MSNAADDDGADDTDFIVTTNPASVPDVDDLISVCQLALDDEIRKMNEVYVSASVYSFFMSVLLGFFATASIEIMGFLGLFVSARLLRNFRMNFVKHVNCFG